MPGFIWSGIRIDRTKQIHKKGAMRKPVPKINMKPFTKKIVLENGRRFYGYGFGADREVINELVFNTSMVGYQEIVTDPSPTPRQTVVMTYPLIGNYGITDEDNETRETRPSAGWSVREYSDMPSNFRYTKTLGEVLEENGIPGTAGCGHAAHRAGSIRNEGSQRALICDADTPCRRGAGTCSRLPPAHTICVSRVSCKKKWYARTPEPAVTAWWRSTAASSSTSSEQLNRVRLQRDRRAATTPPADTILSLQARRRCSSLTAPGNPEDVTPGDRCWCSALRGRAAHLRHLPGASDDFAGLRSARPLR